MNQDVKSTVRNMVYLDFAATALPDPHIIESMARAALEFPGNPSSAHQEGRRAREALDDARRRCAAALDCPPESLIFTSGGTEGNILVMSSCLRRRRPGTLVFSSLEHPSLEESAKALEFHGWRTSILQPDSDGRVTPDRLARILEENPDTALVAVMGVNNEIGTIQPVAELVRTVRDLSGRPIRFHCDLVQAVGKTPVRLVDWGIDTAAIAAHKIRGPRGVGLLYLRGDNFDPLVRSHGQERGAEAGHGECRGGHCDGRVSGAVGQSRPGHRRVG